MKEKAEATCMKRFGTKSPTQNKTILAKSSNTCMTNHNVLWPQQNAAIFQKTTDTFMTKYGVARPGQNAVIKQKTEQTMVARYGTVNCMHNSVVKEKALLSFKTSMYDKILSNRTSITPLFSKDEYVHAPTGSLFKWQCNRCETEFLDQIVTSRNNACPVCFPNHTTWGEQLISEWLTDAGITFEVNNTKIIAPKHLDFYIPSLNLAIEFNGLYWHSEKANRGRTYHRDKYQQCEKLGIKLIQIFEHELITNELLIKHRVIHALKKTANRIFARKLVPVQVSSGAARLFYNENHIQGYLASEYNYGLSVNGEIYAIMSFSKARFSSSIADWELTRYATKSGWSVVGGAQRLFKQFVVTVVPATVVSYADLKWGRGDLYTTLGFSFHHYSQPNYWYFKGVNDVSNRMKFQKHKLPKELHYLGSEWDIMQHLGWNRYWDCGNAVWLYSSCPPS